MRRVKDDVFVYAEGGGDSAALRAEMRRAFAEFFGKTRLGSARRPRVVPCGDRMSAFDSFRTALSQGRRALLLVDSETAIDHHDQAPLGAPDEWRPWSHLKKRDGWAKPDRAADLDCHLLAQCMESWLLSDWAEVAAFFGQGFIAAKKPTGDVESIDKLEVYSVLEQATRACKTKAVYVKGDHSFKLLAVISPDAVCAASPWAARFIRELERRKPRRE